jgi:hypothetical protein
MDGAQKILLNVGLKQHLQNPLVMEAPVQWSDTAGSKCYQSMFHIVYITYRDQLRWITQGFLCEVIASVKQETVIRVGCDLLRFFMNAKIMTRAHIKRIYIHSSESYPT